MKRILPKKSFCIFLIVLFFSLEGFSQTFVGPGTDWNTASNWSPSGVPSTSFSGTIIINSNVNVASITVKSGGTLIVNSPAILTVGTVGNSASTQVVDFQNGSNVVINTGASMKVYGKLNNSNNSDSVKFDGAVSVDGNVTVGNGSTITGSGSLSSTGSVTGAGTVFGTADDCTSGCNYSCSTTAPTGITGSTTICNGSSTTLTLSGGTAGGATAKWYSGSCGGTLVGTGNSVTVSPTTNTTYYVRYEGTCNTTTCASATVTVIATSTTPGTISSPTNKCAGSTGNTFSIAAVSGAISYTWSVTGTGWSVTSGGTTTSATITIGSGVGTVSVTATNACGTSSASTTGSITPTSAPVSPGTITGTATQCPSLTGQTYSVIAIANATNYTWTVPVGWTVTAGTGTNVITVTSGTAGQNGNITVSASNSCGTSASNSLAVTVSPVSVGGSVAGSTTVCAGTNSTVLTLSGYTGTILRWESSLDNFATAGTTIVNTSVTLTATNLSVTTSYRAVLQSGVCSTANSSSATVTVNSLPTAPIVDAVTQPNCTLDTGSVVLSGLPVSGTWTLTRSGTSSATTTGTGSSTTISGLIDGGSYTFTVSNGTCTSVASANVNIDAISTMTSTWNGSVWINGVPDNSKRIVFAGNYSSTTDLTGCSCKITSGANVFINSGHTLTVTNGVDVQTNGSLTFDNNASLVQINDDPTINSGKIIYKRKTPPLNRYDFTYWSSPVAGQTLKALSPSTLYDKYYSYNPNTGWVISYNGVAVMEKGRGYIVRAPQTYAISGNPTAFQASFEGIPNNGVVSFAIAGNLVHLLGNPYPSAIDANAFLDANSTVLEGTLYFWTHNSAPSTGVVGGDATYSYTTNDYATYNRTGGVSTAKAVFTGMVAPIGKIAAGQGFFAPASVAGGTVVFNNSMRVSGGVSGANNSQFFKLSTSKTTTTTAAIEKNRIWLNLFNNEGAFKQTLIGYVTGATNNYDGGFDGVTYDGNAFLDFYSVNQSVNLSIQGRALPFVEKDSVVLGYKSTIKGEFQINIDHTDGVLSSQDVFLEDKDLKIVHNLKKGTYTFNTEKGVFNNRFVLRYVDKNAVVPEVQTPQVNETVLVSVQQNEITVSSSEDLISKIIIYDISGKIIYQKEDVAASDYIIQRLLSSQQVLFVNVILQNGKTTSTKIIY